MIISLYTNRQTSETISELILDFRSRIKYQIGKYFNPNTNTKNFEYEFKSKISDSIYPKFRVSDLISVGSYYFVIPNCTHCHRIVCSNMSQLKISALHSFYQIKKNQYIMF